MKTPKIWYVFQSAFSLLYSESEIGCLFSSKKVMQISVVIVGSGQLLYLHNPDGFRL